MTIAADYANTRTAYLKTLREVRENLVEEGCRTIAPMLPYMYRLKGKPYDISERYFVFEPLFRLHRPKTLTVMTGRQVSKSTSIAGMGVHTCSMIPYYNILYVTPLFEQIRKFSHNYVKAFIYESPRRAKLVDQTCVQSVMQRQFRNGSNMFFSFALLDAERTRGVPASENDIDEVQDINTDFLPIIHQTLGGSPYGYVVYTGTPKSLDNTMETVFRDGSQAEWVIKCGTGGCGHWNVPALEYDLLDMISTDVASVSPRSPGVVCSKCRKPLNPASGHYLHAIRDRVGHYESFHIPQILLPLHYEDPEKWSTLVDYMYCRRNNTFTAFLNECLGVSYDDGSKLLTQTDLQRAAVLPWENMLEEAKRGMATRQYITKIVSVDWGGGGGTIRRGRTKDETTRERTSFTSIAVMGLLYDGSIDVIYGVRSLRTHDYKYEVELIIKILTEFQASYVVNDFNGAGAVREYVLHQAGVSLDALIPVAYHSSRRNLVIEHAPDDAMARAYVSFDKARSLAMTMQYIKCGLVRFFRYDHKNKNQPGLLHDFLSLFEEKIQGANSDIYKISRIENKTDDFAQAVNYGCHYLWYAIAQAWPQLTGGYDIAVQRYANPAMEPSLEDLEDLETAEWDT